MCFRKPFGVNRYGQNIFEHLASHFHIGVAEIELAYAGWLESCRDGEYIMSSAAFLELRAKQVTEELFSDRPSPKRTLPTVHWSLAPAMGPRTIPPRLAQLRAMNSTHVTSRWERQIGRAHV